MSLKEFANQIGRPDGKLGDWGYKGGSETIQLWGAGRKVLPNYRFIFSPIHDVDFITGPLRGGEYLKPREEVTKRITEMRRAIGFQLDYLEEEIIKIVEEIDRAEQ